MMQPIQRGAVDGEQVDDEQVRVRVKALVQRVGAGRAGQLLGFGRETVLGLAGGAAVMPSTMVVARMRIDAAEAHAS